MPIPEYALHSWLLTAVEALATLAFALSGLLEAARKKLDVVGSCVVAGLAAFGGGTLRDVLLDRRPFFWVDHPGWLWFLLVLCIGATFVLHTHHLEPTERAMQWPDALGLGLFSATGTQLALAQHLPAIVAVLMGVVTAVCGGVLRDIVVNEVPRALKDRQPYAVCAFAGGCVVVGLHSLGLNADWSLLGGATAASALRALAMLSGYRLPHGLAGADPPA